MKLSYILKDIDYGIIQGNIEKEINQIQYDSRKITKGDIFVCITGFQTDGHHYAKKALELGACAIVSEKSLEGISYDIPIIQVNNSRKALALLSAHYYNNPSKKINLVGVTGTNGKTTITYLIKTVLDRIGKKVGVVGTIENRIGEKVLKTERTTPESRDLQELFATMVQEQVTDIVMEVSSHSLALDRVAGCDFDISIFTNLTQDHLDYHKTMENYRAAKGILFEMGKKAVINMDDEAGQYMAERAKGKQIITTGIDHKADLWATNIKITTKGVTFTLVYQNKQYPAMIKIPGKFSIYNALSAIGACILMEIEIDDILEALKQCEGVPGRLQTISSDTGIHAIVDYAHTPDGLENVLKTVKEFVEGKVITVFGCGGDRDKTKRPIMGEIAGIYSDYCLITSDNPRTENPTIILDEIEDGMKKTKCDYIKIVDRKEAIFKAVAMAQTSDIIVIAGKGHENYQIFADKTIHFDDVEVVKEAFLNLGEQ